jgi:aspartyl-tRNA(Asn)/glutamyl-tRNA(Gln) amidotransferase subunit C
MIKKEDVEYIAELAKIKLTEEEKELFTVQLGKILEYMNKLNELNTEDVEPLYHFSYLKNVLKEDIPKESSVKREDILLNAPQTEGPYFRVPKVIEES